MNLNENKLKFDIELLTLCHEVGGIEAFFNIFQISLDPEYGLIVEY